MDLRTSQIATALDAVGVEVLVRLLEGTATEAELLAQVAVSQPTLNRHLSRLGAAGLIERPPGASKAPGRAWTVAHAAETDALVVALLRLAAAVDERDRERRDQAARRLGQARLQRSGLRRVSGNDE